MKLGRSTIGRLARNTGGFSLVELMIAIAIVGVLSNIAALRVNKLLGKTRDTIRRETLRRVQLALEAYHNDKGVYPNPGATYYSSEIGDNNYRGADYIPGLAPSYINKLPRDPLSGQSPCITGYYYAYVYVTLDAGKNYKFFSHCASEVIGYKPSDPYYDPHYTTWSWQVTNDRSLTLNW